MTRIREENLAELAEAIGSVDALTLQKVARTLHRLSETACNRELTTREAKRFEGAELEAVTLAEKAGRSIYLQGDPRGWPIYIAKIPGRRLTDSNYNTESIAVCPL